MTKWWRDKWFLASVITVLILTIISLIVLALISPKELLLSSLFFAFVAVIAIFAGKPIGDLIYVRDKAKGLMGFIFTIMIITMPVVGSSFKLWLGLWPGTILSTLLGLSIMLAALIVARRSRREL